MPAATTRSKTKTAKPRKPASKKAATGLKAAMPANVAPMLCTLTANPIADPDYIHEVKWDGYRIIAFVNGDKIVMHSRGGLDYTPRYPLIATALRKLKTKAVLDGEMVVFNKAGMPDFDSLQLYNGHDAPISYCVFDILWKDGYSLKELPLTERKEILRKLIKGSPSLRFSESFDDGVALYEQALEKNLEGIVSKRKDSAYSEGQRANDWLKTPTRKRQEFVIGGWAESDRGRSFRSLLFGAYKDGRLEWIGRSGGGYKEKEMPAILAKLKKIGRQNSPFVNKVLDTKGAKIHWVKPELVANFEFATWTKSGRIRKPATFLGFRKDKKAKDVVRETPKPIAQVEEEVSDDEKEEDAKTPRYKSSPDSNWRVVEKSRPASVSSFDFDDCSIDLYDVDRTIWKGIPKARLIQYYHSVADFILPHLTDRPLSLHLKLNGATAPGLYIKDMEGRQPDCATIFTDKRRHPKAGKRNTIDYLVCNNKATLLYLINLGCIDLNPWMSRTPSIESPDFINIDLDPTDDDFNKVIETALAAKEVLQKLKIISFVKTSGKTGMHIFIPVTGISFTQARVYSERLGERINKLVPNISTTEISISHRGNKVLIDPSQNDYADTLASAYSARPYQLPTVSTPIDWKEVKAGLDPHAFTIDTISKRLNNKGDLFSKVADPKIRSKNTGALKALDG